MRPTLALLCLAACGLPLDDAAGVPIASAAPEPTTTTPALPAGPERVTLTLETRTGDSSRGYSFAQRLLVETALADLHINAFDCGARGRWVSLVGATDVRFCAAAEASCEYWYGQLGAGGSDPAFEGEAWVKKGEQVIGKLKLVAHSPTPQGWYEQDPLPAFEVTVDVTR